MLYSHFKKVNDPISSYTHFLGAVGSLIILIYWIIVLQFQSASPLHWFALLAFGIALVALYSASSYYHTLPHDHKHYTLFRKLDHSMIYVLIVGSYTPFIIQYSHTSLQIVIIMWIIAFLGILLKVFWLQAPRWLYTSLYIILGWSVLFMPSMFINMPFSCLVLVAIGGILYTIGGMIYIIKKPNLKCNWSFHDIFHVFIMLGSLFHIIAVTLFIL